MQFTLSLPTDAADRIKLLVEPFGGTVGSYCAEWGKTISMLPASDQQALRAQLNAAIARTFSSSASSLGSSARNKGTPALAPQTPTRSGAPRPSKNSPRPEAQTLPAHSEAPSA